uniref:Uncharacterized protein n=1 Tax=Oryza sativa subsp. japonica TaxID=39947 RepID=Q6ESK3_ORYSJ|nr:unknown protein [Oryza sativa Japonica Group]
MVTTIGELQNIIFPPTTLISVRRRRRRTLWTAQAMRAAASSPVLMSPWRQATIST